MKKPGIIEYGLYGARKVGAVVERPAFTDDYYSTPARPYNEQQRQNLAWNCAFFKADIDLLGRKVSAPALSVLRREGEETEAVIDHAFERLFRRPNHLFSGYDLMQFSLSWLALAGNAYWLLLPNSYGELREIWPLPANEVKPKPDKVDVIGGYVWRRGSKTDTFTPEQICHFRFINPFSIVEGSGFVSALRYTIEGNMARQRWNHRFFDKKRAIPEAIGVLPKDVSDTDYDRLVAEMEEKFGGGKRSVLWVRGSEKVNIARLGLTHEEMDFLAGQKFDGEMIHIACGFPPGYWDAKANRANAEQAERSLARDTVQPILRMFSAAMEVQIVDRYYEQAGENLTPEFENVVPENRLLALREYQAHSPVMRVSEARGKINQPPLGDERDDVLVADLVRGAGSKTPLPSLPPVKSTLLTDDLHTWRKIVLREVAKGKSPAARKFVSDAIPTAIRARIEAVLATATTEKEVKAAFAAPFRPGSWEGYP